jgi:hypothetical protein
LPDAQRDISLAISCPATAVPDPRAKAEIAKRTTYFFIMKLLEQYFRRFCFAHAIDIAPEPDSVYRVSLRPN